MADYLRLYRPESKVTVRHTSDPKRINEPRTNRAIGEREFNHYAPRLFNKLPPAIRKKSIKNVK